MKKIVIISIALAGILAGLRSPSTSESWNKDTPVYDVLYAVGEPKPSHADVELTPERIAIGEQLVKEGRAALEKGGKSKYISKFYMCTNCHTLEQEDPNLRHSDPDARLDYVIGKGLPFLQGTTFFGIVNRESWYNDDYVLKYGDLVKPASESLRESIQLCAQECSSGRPLEQWEEDAILAYFWTLQLKMGDLELTDDNWAQLKREAPDPDRHEFLRNGLKTFYALKSPADFVDPPADKAAGYGMKGRPEVGGKIYKHSCQTCHKKYGVSQMILDDSKMTARKFVRHFESDGPWSLYEIVRHGTHAEPGHRQYMPHYTAERMSHQQVEDLRAFFEQRAELNP